MMKQAKAVLKSVFGYDDFISLQGKVIENVLQKNDCLVLMPTGGGKSLCYQIPAVIFEGLTIVVSPLISLMKDQTAQLDDAGVPAVFLNSSLSADTYRRNVSRIRKNEVKLLYVAPETLLKPNISELLCSVRVDCLAIDEAHCISMWGHDFRPEYRQLADFRRGLSGAVCIALTATATPRVRRDIKSSLGIDAAAEHVASFDRKNLLIRIVSKVDPLEQTIECIRRYPNESGIVYCYTRKQVESLCEALIAEGFSARPYHAGMNEADRNRHQELFIRDDIHIIVATIAFGMGIDKSNVRFVVHYDMPKTIDNYYQEIGRAGRDGMPAECLLLFSYGDVHKNRYHAARLPEHEKRVAALQLQAMLRLMEADGCRRIPLLDYFGETYPVPECQMCDNCLSEKPEKVDVTVAAQKFLSCIKRTGERFGGAHIIDVLRGSTARKVLTAGHDKLSTYNIGLEYSRRQWQALCRQFLHQGLITQDMEYGGLRLTPKAWEVLRGKKTVLGVPMEPETPELRQPVESEPGSCDMSLFQLLRQERKALADAADVPPYVIFSDKTLTQMATFFPRTDDSLLGIHGVGEVKLEKYGRQFLEIIGAYCREHQIAESVPAGKTGRKPKATAKSRRHLAAGSAFNDGRSVENFQNIVCLANSRKYSGACIAGKVYSENNIGNWIRPVSGRKTGELEVKETLLDRNRPPALLDIFSVPVDAPCPDTYQSENCRIGNARWQYRGKYPPSEIHMLCDAPERLWINGFHSHGGFNNRIPEKQAETELDCSLYLIAARKLRLVVTEGVRGLHKVTVKFEYRGENYWLTVTDPDIEKAYIGKSVGEYPVSDDTLFLTISISEPFEGFCYKLVAGLIAAGSPTP